MPLLVLSRYLSFLPRRKVMLRSLDSLMTSLQLAGSNGNNKTVLGKERSGTLCHVDNNSALDDSKAKQLVVDLWE